MKGKTTPLLHDCPEDKSFRVADGSVFRNYAQLLDGLKRMEDEVFRSHVAEGRNDFKEWVLHVYSDDKLAREMEEKPNRIPMAQSVARRLKALALRH